VRCVTYGSPATSGRRVSIVDGEEIRGLVDDGQLIDLLGDDGARLAAAADSARRDPYEVVPLATAVLAAPVPTPPSVRDFMAFKAHVTNSMRALGRDVDPDWYKLPVFYFTNPAAVHGPYDEVSVSPGSAQFDYELVEVAAVVGREDVDLHPEDAEAHIAGYTILCGWRPGTCRCARCASSSALSRARIPRRRWAWPWSTTPPRSCSAKPSRPAQAARRGTRRRRLHGPAGQPRPDRGVGGGRRRAKTTRRTRGSPVCSLWTDIPTLVNLADGSAG